MFRKNYFAAFAILAGLFLAASVGVFAQSAPVRGKVVLKQADGTLVPVVDAVIDVYRTDLKAKLPSGKTNKKGEFVFAGFPAGARVALVVSAPNIKPQIAPNVKGGDEAITITVTQGDGKRLTEEEARQSLDQAAATTTTSDGKPIELTPEQKKAQEELEKKNAEILAGNKKAENINATVNKSMSEGIKAFNEKNYDLAIASYDEGINADPEFEGSAPILLNNKSIALISRAIDKYKASFKGEPSGKAALLESAKKDLNDSLAASDKALQILSSATSTDASAQKRYAAEKQKAYVNLVDGYSRMFSMSLDTSKGQQALAALDSYVALETDAAMKSKWRMILADAFRLGGDAADAVVVYRKIIETEPDNPDALAGLGLSLFSVGAGVVPENTEQEQEGLNFMQRFTEVAPDNHPLKASVKDAVDYLKTKQLAPQKTKTTTKKKS